MKFCRSVLMGFLVVCSFQSRAQASLPEAPLINLIKGMTPADHLATLNTVTATLQQQVTAVAGLPLIGRNCGFKPRADHDILAAQLDRCTRAQNLLAKNVPTAGTVNKTLFTVMCTSLAHERVLLSSLSEPERAETLRRITRLYHDVIDEDFSTSVSPQSFVLGLVLTLIVTFGLQNEVADINKGFSNRLSADAAKIKQLAKDLSVHEATLTSNTQTVLKQLAADFTQNMKKISDSRGAAEQALSQEIQYIQQLINTSVTPEPFFNLSRESIIQTARYFSQSAMTTPNTAYTWYNVWGSAAGLTDWAFDPALGGFVQRAVTPGERTSVSILRDLPLQWMLSGNVDARTAEQNSIFTEYFTTASSYVIEVELTVFNNGFPFLAGIMFNKPRWVSGSPDRMYSYRFVGIYGDSNKGISFYAGQSMTSQKEALSTVHTPLDGILVRDSELALPLYTYDRSSTPLFAQQPHTYTISILTQKSQFNVTIIDKTTGVTLVNNKPIGFNNPTMNTFFGWYHGIGFMSPGAQTLFKIIKPVELSYTVGAATALESTRRRSRS